MNAANESIATIESLGDGIGDGKGRPAKWRSGPVQDPFSRIHFQSPGASRGFCFRAFSSEVDTGSREPDGRVSEYASKQKARAPIRYYRIGAHS